MKTIYINDENLVSELEISHYEYNYYLNMLEFAKSNGYNNEYWNLWQQYMQVRLEYDTLKEKIRVNYIIPAVGDNYPGWWDIDFKTNVIHIYKN